MNIDLVFVAGAGTMGSGIAQCFAQGGFDVLLYDDVPEVAAGAVPRMEKGLQKVVEKGKMTADDVAAILARIQTADDLAPAAQCQFAIEAIIEDFTAKADLLTELSSICPPHTILATNTSSLSVTDLGQASGRAANFLGLHFFNPAPIMKLVELVVAPETSSETAETVRNLAVAIGKVPVLVKDSPGFVCNRLLIPMINEAIVLLEEGVASAEDIDTTMKLGCGFPMGPLELSDLIGNDIILAVMESLRERLGSDRYEPAGLLEEMVAESRLGRKTGSGFTCDQ